MKKLVFFFLFFCAGTFVLKAQSNLISLIQFSTGYTSPQGIENCGDSRLFIVQKNGQIMICDSAGNRFTTPFLNISDRIKTTGSEQGLLGLAFDPKYSANGFFYVNYTNKSGNTQISRFKVSSDPNKADAASEKFILQVEQPFANHNGGCMRFGPDGYLYIGSGDGGSGGDPFNNAQNPATLLGKILRLNVNTSNPYDIPPTNPFVDSANYKKEIWALGVRNPWRFSFDALSGALIIADVGQDEWEEINVQLPKSKGGENYGWRCYEGNHPYNTSGCSAKPAYTFPVYEYSHSSGTNDCSVTGGFVYRGKRYPALYGKYFFADYCSGIIRALYLTGNGGPKEKDVFTGDAFAYTSFGENKSHELFVTNYVNGRIYRVASASATTQNGADVKASLVLYPNPAPGKFSVRYTTDKAEECSVKVFNSTGKQVYEAKQTAVAGNNVWNVVVPQFVKGNCYVIVSGVSGTVSRQNILVQ